MSCLLEKPASYSATNISHLPSTLQFTSGPHDQPRGRHCRNGDSHSRDEGTEAQRGKVTCPKSQSRRAGPKPGPLCHKLASPTASQPQGPGHGLAVCLILSRTTDPSHRLGGLPGNPQGGWPAPQRRPMNTLLCKYIIQLEHTWRSQRFFFSS